MAKHGKNFAAAREKIDREMPATAFAEGLSMALEAKYGKFDETVDVAVRLGVDPRHADQMVRGTVVLPHGTGKSVTVLVFAKGEKKRRPPTPGPTTWAATSWWKRSRAAGPISTGPSPPRT